MTKISSCAEVEEFLIEAVNLKLDEDEDEDTRVERLGDSGFLTSDNGLVLRDEEGNVFTVHISRYARPS